MGTISQVAASNTAAGSGASVATNLPTGIQTGDIVLLFVTSLATISTPAGWTSLSSSSATDGATTVHCSIFSKTTVTGADSNAALTISFGSAANYAFSFLVLRGSGSRGSRVVTPSVLTYSSTPTNPVQTATVTPSIAGSMVIGVMAAAYAPATLSNYAVASGDYTITSGSALADYRLVAYATTSPVTAGQPYFTFVQLPFVGTNAIISAHLVVVDKQDEHVLAEGVSGADSLLGNIPLQYAEWVDETDISDLARRDIGATLGETLALLDTRAAQSFYRPTMAEGGRVIDRPAAAQVMRLAEVVGVAEQTRPYPSVRLTDTVAFQPVVQPRVKLALTVAEQTRVIDVLRRVLGGEITLSIGLSEATTRAWRMARAAADALTVADALTNKLVLRISVVDHPVVDDATASAMAYSTNLQDVVEIAAAYLQPGDTFTTWVMNARTTAVTEYDSFAFNSFAEIAPGRYIAASEDGVYDLQGDDDDGAPIMARIKSGLMQFAGSRFVGLKGVYLGMRASGDFYLKLETGDGQTYTYLTRVENMETTKVHVGKGLRTRYLSFELANKDGQDFDLDTVEFVPMWAQRRV